MNVSVYIARKMKGDASSTGKISRLSTRIATVSVAVSLFVMLLSLAIVRGFKAELESKAVAFSSQVIVEAPGARYVTEPLPISTQLSYWEGLTSMPQLRHTQRFATANGVIKTEKSLQGIQFKGVGGEYNWDFFAKHLCQGRLPVIEDSKDSLNVAAPSGDLLVSQRMARLLELEVDAPVTVYFIGTGVRLRKFTVCGIYDAQFEEMDSHLVMGDIRHAQALNNWTGDQISGLECFFTRPGEVDSGMAAMEEYILTHTQDSDQGVTLRSVFQIYAHLYDWIRLMDTNVLILLVLMVLVAGFNMISGLLIMQFEKTAMIGLLKSMGMKDRDVAACFLYKAATIVGKGMIWGVTLGVLFCVVQAQWHLIPLDPGNYFVDAVPIRLNGWDVLGVVVGSMASILLLLRWPLRGVTRVSPTQAIQFQL